MVVYIPQIHNWNNQSHKVGFRTALTALRTQSVRATWHSGYYQSMGFDVSPAVPLPHLQAVLHSALEVRGAVHQDDGPRLFRQLRRRGGTQSGSCLQ